MKKLLLFTLFFSLIAITSCTKNEDTPELSQEEKELLVKHTLIEFNKSAIKTGKLHKFSMKLSQKTASGDLSNEELEALIQDFLGDQTQAFLDLYYQLLALNLTDNEFYEIAYQYEDLRLSFLENISGNKSNDHCNGVGYADTIMEWLLGCKTNQSQAAEH